MKIHPFAYTKETRLNIKASNMDKLVAEIILFSYNTMNIHQKISFKKP